MRTIWKFELERVDEQMVRMPRAPRQMDEDLLHVGCQDGIHPVVWAMVETDWPMDDRLLLVVGTGNPAPEPWDGTYVGSAICGPFVWHIFDGGWHR